VFDDQIDGPEILQMRSKNTTIIREEIESDEEAQLLEDEANGIEGT
jgi:hypothetical protein